MATISDYTGSVPLQSGLIPKGEGNDFALMEAHSIQVGEGDKRLDTELEEIKEVLETSGKEIEEIYLQKPNSVGLSRHIRFLNNEYFPIYAKSDLRFSSIGHYPRIPTLLKWFDVSNLSTSVIYNSQEVFYLTVYYSSTSETISIEIGQTNTIYDGAGHDVALCLDENNHLWIKILDVNYNTITEIDLSTIERSPFSSEWLIRYDGLNVDKYKIIYKDGTFTTLDIVPPLLNGEDYITPEMFSAIGGDHDDYNALQRCFSYAKENEKSVILTQDYRTSQSLIIENKGNYIPNGINIDGNNKTIVITDNVPALIIRGNGHRIQNLTVEYDNSFYDETTEEEEYISSLVQLQSIAAQGYFVCDRNRFTNVVCRSGAEFRGHTFYNSVGFEFILQGNATTNCHAYNNEFIACDCRNLGTAIKITENEYSSGCNGNRFEISSWANEFYLNGKTDGCIFSGLVQPTGALKKDSEENVLNEYLIQNIGNNNVFDNVFFDYNDTTDLTRQMIADNSGKYNVFTQMIYDRATPPTIFNRFNMSARTSGDVIMPINPGLGSGSPIPVMTYLPFRNSFNAIETATISVSDNIFVGQPPYAWDEAKYPSADFENGLPKNIAPLFHDDSKGRRAGFFRSDGNEGIIDIEFTPLGIIPVMWIYWGSYSHPDKIELITEYSTGTIYSKEFILNKTSLGGFGCLSDRAVDEINIPTKATIRFTFSSNENMYISQICGYMYSSAAGII